MSAITSTKRTNAPPARARGGASFACPSCAKPTKVLSTRKTDDGKIHRFRICLHTACGWRGDTVEDLYLFVRPE